MSLDFIQVQCRDGRVALQRHPDGSYGLAVTRGEALAATLTAAQVRELVAPFPELRSSDSEVSAALDTCNWANELAGLTFEQRQGFDLALSCVGRFLGVPATIRVEPPCPTA